MGSPTPRRPKARGRVILLAGCSGSGKSTYGRKAFPKALVVSADHYFEALAARTGRSFEEVWNLGQLGAAHAQCLQRFTEALAAGRRLVVVDNTNVLATERQRFVKKALEQGYEVEFHVLGPWREGEPPLAPEAEADYVKACHGRNAHGVPLEIIEQQFTRLDLPAGVFAPGKPPRFLRPLEP